MMNLSNNKYFFAILAFLVVPISGLSIDIYVPSLPAVTEYFKVNKSLAQLSITTYMIGLGSMQLFAGIISDSFGRRRPFLIAIFIYLVATLLVPLSSTINGLLILRFIQGASVALTVVPMRSVIADLFHDRELYTMMNYMTMSWSIGPIIAPAIGGYLQHYFGWKANFYFLAIYSVLMFIAIFIYLPETSAHKHPFKITAIFTRYYQMLFNKEFAIGIMIDGLLYSLIILFGTVGPFIFQTVLHYSVVQFGHISLLMGLAWFWGTMTNRFVIDIPLMRKAAFCLLTMFVILTVLLIMALFNPLNVYSLIIGNFVLLWVGGIIFPNYFAKNMTLFPTMTGSANALFGSLVFLIAGGSGAMSTFLKTTTEVPLITAYMVLILLSLILFYLSNKNKQIKS